MNDNFELVRHFYSIDEVERAVEILEDDGVTTEVNEEERGSDDRDGVYALYVPEKALERAEQLLEAGPSEEEGAVSMFADYERESDEVREAYRQD